DLEAALSRAKRASSCGASGETLSKICLVEAHVRYWRGEQGAAAASARRAIEHADRGSRSWFHAIQELVTPITDLGGVSEVVEWAKAAFEASPTTTEAAEAAVACLSWCA